MGRLTRQPHFADSSLPLNKHLVRDIKRHSSGSIYTKQFNSENGDNCSAAAPRTMAAFPDFATELLLNIYKDLDNIDDVLHLARSSKTLYAVFDTYRFEILKSVILSSSIHTYDVMLCYFQDTVQAFSEDHPRSGRDTIPIKMRPPWTWFDMCFDPEPVRDQQIWDIVARWQGLRPLQQLYLNPVIHSEYTSSLCVTGSNNTQETEMLDILRLARDGSDVRHNNGDISTNRVFSSAETGRFYKALTAYWVAVESRKLARQCRYSAQPTQNKTFDMVASLWEQRTDLQESLDVLEVFDFVYGFLCEHIDGVDINSFTDWVDDDLFTINEPLRSERAFFIKNLWMALDPPDVLELLHFTSLWREQAGSCAQTWSKETRRYYLRLRGFFSPSLTENVVFTDGGETPDAWYSIPALEKACELQLQKMDEDRSMETAVAWASYRTTLWQTDARGRFGQMQNLSVKLQDLDGPE